jgi:hypothetical protein
MKDKKENIIVFDLDETLGYFCELSIFIDSLEKILNKKLSKNDFFETLDLFPEFFRPNIINILKYIKSKKVKHKIKVMIYTNNQKSPVWAKEIKDYIEYKLGYKLFDQVILAFKIGGVKIEPNRTTHNKTLSDFINCTHITEPVNVCFIDDQHHPGMIHDDIYYIEVFPYYNFLNFDEMIERYYEKNKDTIKNTNFKEELKEEIKKYNFKVYEKPKEDYQLEKIISKKILNMIDDFFKTRIEHFTKKNIKRLKHSANNKTKKLI